MRQGIGTSAFVGVLPKVRSNLVFDLLGENTVRSRLSIAHDDVPIRPTLEQ